MNSSDSTTDKWAAVGAILRRLIHLYSMIMVTTFVVLICVWTVLAFDGTHPERNWLWFCTGALFVHLLLGIFSEPKPVTL